MLCGSVGVAPGWEEPRRPSSGGESRRNTNRDDIRRNVRDHRRASADHGSSSDLDPIDDGGTDADEATVSETDGSGQMSAWRYVDRLVESTMVVDARTGVDDGQATDRRASAYDGSCSDEGTRAEGRIRRDVRFGVHQHGKIEAHLLERGADM